MEWAAVADPVGSVQAYGNKENGERRRRPWPENKRAPYELNTAETLVVLPPHEGLIDGGP